MRRRVNLKLIITVLVLALFGAARAQSPDKPPLDPAAWGDTHAGKPVPPYAGGDECLFCHRSTVGMVWQSDPHFTSIRSKFRNLRTAPEIEALAADPRFRALASEVDYVLGGDPVARYLRRDAEGHLEILNVVLHAAKGDRAARLAVEGEPRWDAKKFSDNCAGCHTLGFEAATRQSFEPFVGCESCHGPFDDRHTTGEVFQRFASKANDAPRVIASTCGSCLLRGGRSRSTGRPFADNFVASDNLFKDFQFDFSRADDPSLNPADAHIQRNIRDIVIEGKTSPTCLSCHQMHPMSTDKHRRRAKSAYCLLCHKEEDYKQLVRYEVHSATCEY